MSFELYEYNISTNKGEDSIYDKEFSDLSKTTYPKSKQLTNLLIGINNE